MNKLIEFRAWDEKQSYMAYQGTPDLETLQSFIFHFGDKKLMLYIGYKDKEDNKLYAGDLIKDINNGNILRIFQTLGGFGVNVFPSDLYNLNDESIPYLCLGKKENINWIQKHCIKIGNIYEGICEVKQIN